ncbi:HNH endonuclease, partial [Cryobacterium sandaracinum]
KVLSLSTENRFFNRAQRRAIAARDGGCVIPGCTVPAAWCEVHHVIPWHRGGKTEIDNGVLLCWYHHHSIDTSGWNIRMIRGTPEVRAPYCFDPTRTWRPGGGNPASRSPVSAGSTSVNVPSRNRVTTAS